MEENGSADGVGRLRWVCFWGDFFCESDAAFSSCGAAIVLAVAVGAALALAEDAPVVHAATKFDPRAVVTVISVAAEVAAVTALAFALSSAFIVRPMSIIYFASRVPATAL